MDSEDSDVDKEESGYRKDQAKLADLVWQKVNERSPLNTVEPIPRIDVRALTRKTPPEIPSACGHQLKDLYSPLEPGLVRLVDINAKYWTSDTPSCTLRNVRIGSEPYVAISYTWLAAEYSWYGEALPTTTELTINGLPILVPPHIALIFAVLQKVRIPTVWIDCLSINQDDKAERGHQRALMNQIFEGASEVFIFLGKPNDDTDRMLRRLPTWNDFQDTGRAERGLRQILSHRYWHRAWILQEIGMARSLKIAYGECLLDNKQSNDLVRQLLAFEDKTHLREYLSLINKIALGIRLPLADVLVATIQTECSEPRDAVYAKMHLAHDGHMLGDPDYTESVVELFTRATRLCLINSSSLQPLVFASGYGNRLGLPSWAVDWASGKIPAATHLAHLVVGSESRTSGSRLSFPISWSDDQKELVVQGRMVRRMKPIQRAGIAETLRHLLARFGILEAPVKAETTPPEIDDGPFICLISGCPSPLVLVRRQDHYTLLNVGGPDIIKNWAQRELSELVSQGDVDLKVPITEFRIR